MLPPWIRPCQSCARFTSKLCHSEFTRVTCSSFIGFAFPYVCNFVTFFATTCGSYYSLFIDNINSLCVTDRQTDRTKNAVDMIRGPYGNAMYSVVYKFNPLMGKLKQQRTIYSNMVTDTLAVDGWAVRPTFGTARSGLGRLWPRPVPCALYQMKQPTHQRPVHQLHIIGRGAIITCDH